MIPRDQWQTELRHVGRRVLLFDEVDSTNTRAALLGDDPANDGVVLLADVQTGGRGQHRRSWLCPPRSGVLMSVLLFPPPLLRRPALLTAWAAVSVCETLRAVADLPAMIKWPNDVLVHGRKVCGILIECGSSPAGGFRAVAGLGLNLNQDGDDFAKAGLPQAGSLRMFTGQCHDRNAVARRLLHALDEEYQRLVQGDLATLEDLWQRRLGLRGKTVTAECGDSRHRGRLVEMGWDGLWLDVPGREGPLVLAPEAVRHLDAVS